MRERWREKVRDFSSSYTQQGKEKIDHKRGHNNKIMWIIRKIIAEDCIIIGGLILVQFFYAGNSVFLNYLMLLGVNPLTIIIFSSFATFLILSAPSVYIERSRWPNKLSKKLMIQLALISVVGVTLFQILFLKGIELTSPAMATAMPNLAPGLIFVIATAFRMEKIDLSCIYSKLKISGTLLCVIGALTLSIMQSASHPHTAREIDSSVTKSHTSPFDIQKVVGCIYLMSAVFILSSNIVLQASILAEFSAPISLCATTSLLGMISTIIWELIRYQKFDYGWPIVSIRDLAAYSLFGGIVGGVCVSFSGWAMKKRGPVLVSMFNPIATVISVILSYFTMGEVVSFGSIIGMFLMFSGLYFFLWAKGKEQQFTVLQKVDLGDDRTPKVKGDVENPLLS